MALKKIKVTVFFSLKLRRHFYLKKNRFALENHPIKSYFISNVNNLNAIKRNCGHDFTTSNISFARGVVVVVSLGIIKLLHRCFINHGTNEQEKERTVPCPTKEHDL